jgi:hypothetical protein
VRIGRICFVFVASSVVVSCDRQSSESPMSPLARMASRNLALALQPPVRTIDDMFEDVARREPTFGGLYFDKGRLHVVLTDVGRDPEIVRTAIRGVFADARFSRAPIQVEPGRYSYSQLGAWGRQLPRAFGVPG